MKLSYCRVAQILVQAQQVNNRPEVRAADMRVLSNALDASKGFKPGYTEKLQPDGSSFSPKQYGESDGEVQSIQFSATDIGEIGQVQTFETLEYRKSPLMT